MGEWLKQSNGISSETTTSFSSSCNSSESLCSSTSNLTDDATSSSTTSQMDSDGPLYELSSLIAQLPIRKGLSNYFPGKSQSFTSLSDVRCVEDLAKKGTPYSKRMKTCKSHARRLDASQRQDYIPGLRARTISKKPSRASFVSLLSRSSSNSLVYSRKPLPYVVQKTL